LVAVLAIANACGGEAKEGAGRARSNLTEYDSLTVRVARQAIELANARSGDALIKGDVEGVVASYATNAAGSMPNERPWHNLDELRAATKSMLDSVSFSSARRNTDDLFVSGDLAVELGSGMLSFGRRSGKNTSVTLRYLAVWRRQRDGSLRVVRELADVDTLPPR
jgi:ketosteroid isomerase-like protein